MDDNKTIEQLIQESVSELGEAIQVRRFSRFALGENTDADGTDGE